MPGAPPRPVVEPRRVLAIQLKRLGDVVLATPAFRALKAAWPAARLTVLTEAPFHEILAGVPGPDEVLVHPRGLLASLNFGRRLAAEGYDAVFDFYGSATSARLALASGAPLRVGWAHRGRRLAYTRAVTLPPAEPARFTADQKLDLLRAVGMTPVDSAPRLCRPATPDPDIESGLAAAGLADRPFLLVAPASRRAYKRWSTTGWASVIAGFHAETGAPTLLAGGPGEEAQVDGVRAALPAAALAGILTVPRITAWLTLLDRAALLLGPDGGVRQMAQAQAVPTLGLFGPQEPAHWICPVPPGRHVGLRGRRADCAIHCSRGEAPCACLASRPPEEILERLLALWRAAAAAPLR